MYSGPLPEPDAPPSLKKVGGDGRSVERLVAAAGQTPSPVVAVPASPIRGAERRRRAVPPQFVWALASVVIVLGTWEVLGDWHVINKTFFSTPSGIVSAAFVMFGTGEFWTNLRSSGFEFLVGYGLSIVVAVPAGLVIGSSNFLTFLFEPWLAFLYALPRIALTPLILIWAGIGVRAIIIVVFLGSFFTIILSVIEGARQADARYKRVAAVYGASRMRHFLSVTTPSSVPFVLSGLRLGVARAVIGVVIGELLAGLPGLGHFIAVSSESFQGSQVLAATSFLILFALVTSAIIQRAELRFSAWRE